MSFFVRTPDGEFVNLAFAERLASYPTGDAYAVIAHFPDDVEWTIFRDPSQRKAEQMLAQLAARANGSDVLPIDTDSPVALRRGLRFGETERHGAQR